MPVLVVSAAPRKMDEATRAFTKTYMVVFDRLKGVELSDTQTRITRLAAKGKAFQPQLDALRKRQFEVSDLLVEAVEQRKKAEADRKVEAVDAAVKILVDADARSIKLAADVVQLNDQLTAAGAPKIDPGPPRDPNARD